MTGPAQDRLALESDEDQHSAAEWEKITAAVLRKSGRLTDEDPDSAVWEKLARTNLDGISVAPIGIPAHVEDLATSGRPTRAHEWDIRAHVSGPDARAANQALLADLANGATSVWVQLDAGLAIEELGVVLDDVLLGIAPVTLDAPRDQLAAARTLADLLPANPAPGTNLGVDPIGASLRTGGFPAQPPQSVDAVAVAAELAREKGVLGLVVDGSAIHDLGASDGQELGYSLAVGAAYLRALVEAGTTLEDALRLIEFRYAATDEQFPTIAKLRAARRLWARVAELSGAYVDAGSQLQHAVTSRPMMGRYDPWVNMLRTTVAAFAAGVGGAEAVTVLPFDSTLGEPDAFGRRIARNTSSLLIHESHVAKVVDPAGGSYAVERLTDDLARVAWEEFGRIEAAGGILAALADGALEARVEQVAAHRETEVARRQRPLTGISEFPNLAERLPDRLPSPAADAVRRYGAAFESLRDEPATGEVFLATMGPIAAHTARASFAGNLFAAGGIGVGLAGATDGTDAVLAAYDGQPVVCLAGTDAAYAEWGAELVAALRDAGAQHVILAGKPGDRTIPAELVDDSCAVGVDALAFLRTTREKLA